MASISTSLGLGSGIDTTQLVTDLTAAARAPKEKQIAAKEAANKAKVSALAEAANGIDTFATALNTLIGGGSLYTQPTSSDANALGLTALPGSRLSGLSAQVEVRALAKGQSLVSATGVPSTTTFDPGTFNIVDSAGNKKLVTVGANDNTMAGIARAINAAGAGVTASIVTQGNTSRLVMKGETGASSAFTVETVTDSPQFAQFAFGTSNDTGMTSTQTAQDATVVVDGIVSTRPTNNISDLIDGVRMDLKKVTTSEGVSVSATPPAANLRQAVQDFASAYNELKKTLDTSTANGLGGGAVGPLRGNTGVRELQRQLARLNSMTLNSGGSPSTLAEIGVKTERDGTLSVDLTTLDKTLADNPEGVEALFNPSQRSSSPLVQITSAMGKTKPGTYEVTNIVTSPLSGTIAGRPGFAIGGVLYASGTSAATGLGFKVQPGVTSATITVDPGLGGALTAIRDQLRTASVGENDSTANGQFNGALAVSNKSLLAEAAQLAKDRTQMETQSEVYKAKLTKSFTDMEKRVTALNATKAYLTQQIDQWNSDS